MFYVINRDYVGPNPREHLDDETYRIQTVPGRTNMSNEPRTEGWLGTTNDWTEYAYGEFETEAAARDKIITLCQNKLREIECLSDDYKNYDSDDNLIVIARFKPGLYKPCEDSIIWCWKTRYNITANTTDEEIEKIIADCESGANKEDMTLDQDAVRTMLHNYRAELIEEAKDENE